MSRGGFFIDGASVECDYGRYSTVPGAEAALGEPAGGMDVGAVFRTVPCTGKVHRQNST